MAAAYALRSATEDLVGPVVDHQLTFFGAQHLGGFLTGQTIAAWSAAGSATPPVTAASVGDESRAVRRGPDQGGPEHKSDTI